MAESRGSKQEEKRQSGTRQAHRRVMQKQLVSARRGVNANELVEDQASGGGILQQRAAVRSVSGNAVSTVPSFQESRFAHDLSQVPTHTAPPQSSYPQYYGMDARGGGGGGEVEDQHTGATPPAAGGGAPAAAPARPSPINVRNGPTHAPINSGDRVGMSIAITISSSSGRDADMAAIQDSEQVGLSYNHTGCMSGQAPLPSSQSGFMAGHPIPDDQHGWSKATIIDLADNHGGSGSFEKKQLDIYTDAAGGVTSAIAIPASGYIIKRIITKTGTSISFRTEKRAAGVTVNSYTTTAGPSPTQGDTVQIRP